MRWRRSGSTSTCRSTGWRRVLAAAGMVFLWAPRHHSSMRHAAGPRVELGTRTIFNILGPLSNPARVKRQLTGAFSVEWLRPMAETLARLGTEAAWVVHGQGLDEIALSGETQVVALEDGRIREFTVTPGGCRAGARPARGDPRRRAGGERRRPPRVVAGRPRRLPRHRAAQCRGRPCGGRAGRRSPRRRGDRGPGHRQRGRFRRTRPSEGGNLPMNVSPRPNHPAEP